MKELKNRTELIEEVAKLLKTYDQDLNSYDTDVYLYVKDGIGTLYEFVNVGGNSWLNDDHTTIYTDRQHYNTIFDDYSTLEEYADAINMDEEEFKKKVQEFAELEENEEPDEWHCERYIRSKDDLYELLKEDYSNRLEEVKDTYYEEAERIIEEYERGTEI